MINEIKYGDVFLKTEYAQIMNVTPPRITILVKLGLLKTVTHLGKVKIVHDKMNEQCFPKIYKK